MKTVTLDDATHAELTRRARGRGLTVAAFLADEFPVSGRADAPQADFTPEGWERWLRGFAERHEPTGTSLDDSRESMYR